MSLAHFVNFAAFRVSITLHLA